MEGDFRSLNTDKVKGVNGTIDEYSTIVDSTRVSKKNVVFTHLRQSSRLREEIISMSDYHFKLISIGNVPFIYGVKPETIYYAIEINTAKGFPNIDLIPVI